MNARIWNALKRVFARGASGSSFAFSPALVANLGLDNPNMLAAIDKDAARERATTMPRHIISAKIARLYSRPTAEQRAIEADANALANSYGLWHGQRIASVCGGLEAPEAAGSRIHGGALRTSCRGA